MPQPDFLKNIVLPSTQLLKLRIRAVAEKMSQDIAALAAIQNKIQLRLGHFPSQRLEKLTPRCAMHRMAIHENTIHIENDSAQRPGFHDDSPGFSS